MKSFKPFFRLGLLVLAVALLALPPLGCKKLRPPKDTTGNKGSDIRKDAGEVVNEITIEEVRAALEPVFGYCAQEMESVKKSFADSVDLYSPDNAASKLSPADVLEMLNEDCVTETQFNLRQILISNKGTVSKSIKDANEADCKLDIKQGEAWAEIRVDQRSVVEQEWAPGDPAWYLYTLKRDPDGTLKIFAKYLACPAGK